LIMTHKQFRNHTKIITLVNLELEEINTEFLNNKGGTSIWCE
jgi:hypothetical protein